VTKMLWKESDRGIYRPNNNLEVIINRPNNNLEVIINEAEIRYLLDTLYIHKLK
jgi:hypothetical protein